MTKIIVYTDGASRGNPGPSAIGVAICLPPAASAKAGDANGRVLKEYSKAIGKATNNEAEYQAVIFALKKIKALFGKKKVKDYEIEVKSDSQLLVSQLKGEYKLKEPHIQKLFIQVWNLMTDLGKVDFKYIPREENKLADKLANEALDRDNSNRKLF